MRRPRGWMERWLARRGAKGAAGKAAGGSVREQSAGRALEAGGERAVTPGARLRERMDAALEAAEREDAGGGGGMWRGRSVLMSHAALRAWLAKDPSRPAEGFYGWASDPQRLADWVGQHEREALLDGEGRLRQAWSALRAYVGALPGHQMGQAVGPQSVVMHGYVAMQCFGCDQAQWRYEERLCDEPGLAERLALAGMAPSARPSKDEAQAALAFWEGEQIAAAMAGGARLGSGARAHGARL